MQKNLLEKIAVIIIIVPILLFFVFIMVSDIQQLVREREDLGPGQPMVITHPGALPTSPVVFRPLSDSQVLTFFDPETNIFTNRYVRTNNSNRLEVISFYISNDREGDIWLRLSYLVGDITAGEPIEITTQGDIYRCRNSPYGHYRITPLGGDELLAVVHQEDRSTDLIEYDLSSCAYGETLLSVDDYVYEAFRSVSGFWAVWREAHTDQNGDIDIYSPAGEFLYTIENASYPTWAHNRDILTFVRDVQDHRTFHDQIWVFEQDISREELIFEMDDSYEQPVVWSPDDTHLLFYQVDGFYFYELNGGDVTVYPCDPGRAVWR